MKKNDKKKIKKALLGAATSISVLTGCGVENKVVDDTKIVSNSNSLDFVDIGNVYKEALSRATGNDINHSYTIEDLKKISDLAIEVVDNSSLDWLGHCENLKNLVINIENSDVIYLLNSITVLPNLEFFGLIDFNGNYYNEENLSFLKNDTLSILSLCGNLVVDKNFLYNMNSLKDLRLLFDSAINLDTNRIGELENLASICFYETPYTAAIYVDTNDYNKLKDSGIKVLFDDGDQNKFENANRVLDDIAFSLGLNDEITKQEKLNRIILYALDNFEYDMSINEMVGTEELVDTNKFYDGGYLKGIIEGDGKIICGNYAALVGALAKRAGMDMFILKSNNHAWNLVDVDGEYYYVDATVLDAFNYNNNDDFVRSLIESNNTLGLDWYMKEYQSNEELDDSHIIVNTSYEDIDNIIENNNKIDINYDEISEYNEEVELADSYDVNINNKRRAVSAAALVGILVGLGYGKKAYKNKVKKNKKHKRR